MSCVLIESHLDFKKPFPTEFGTLFTLLLIVKNSIFFSSMHFPCPCPSQTLAPFLTYSFAVVSWLSSLPLPSSVTLVCHTAAILNLLKHIQQGPPYTTRASQDLHLVPDGTTYVPMSSVLFHHWCSQVSDCPNGTLPCLPLPPVCHCSLLSAWQIIRLSSNVTCYAIPFLISCKLS